MISFNAAISACENGVQWHRVAPLLDEMCRSGLSLDVISLNAAISACEKGGQWQHVVPLLEGSLPNMISINAAISACENGGQEQCVVPLLAEMRGEGLSRVMFSFITAISA